MPPATLVAGPVMPGPAAPLPKDLAAWIDGARAAGEKVVYAALGATFVRDPEKSKEIVRALDQAAPSARLLVKFSASDLPEDAERELREELNSKEMDAAGKKRGKSDLLRRGPERLRIVPWAPQNDLLGTPGAVSLYVTHGGISSLSEAAYHGVPVVALPQGAEQPDNAAKVEHRGLGVGLRRGASAAELAAAVKEDLKTVALGTSKINYMDPRITVAWCKRNEVPIEKVFNKSLIAKFHWAMDVDWQFHF